MLCKSGRCAIPTPYCRDLGDVCGWDADCCSGDRCTAGSCAVNHAPVIDLGPSPVLGVPRRQPRPLFNRTTDPDGDALIFGWSLLSSPAGSTAALSSVTAASPTFTPDLEGTYVFELTATDSPAPGLTSTGTVTLQVINTPPVVTPQAAVTSGRRNVTPVAISAVVNDPDGDDITCTWEFFDPAGASRGTVGPAGCFGAPGVPDDVTVSAPFPTGLLPADEGTWRAAISATDGKSITSADVLVTVGNDPPTPAVSRTPSYANLAAIPADTAPVVLDASASTDPNGDQLGPPGLTYAWAWDSVSDGGALPTINNPATATPDFVPIRAADYVLKLTVTDPPGPSRAGASSTLLVTVKVGRYIQQLAHDVIESAYAKTANRLILAGHDPADATRGKIWVYDAATGTEGTGIQLVDTSVSPSVYGVPKLVDVTPDGTTVVVVDDNVSVWFVKLGASTTVTRQLAPFQIRDLVVAGARYAYVFNTVYFDITLGQIRQFDLTNTLAASTKVPWSGYSGYGAASAGSTTSVYRVDETSTRWEKYSVTNNGANPTTFVTGASGPYCGTYPSTQATAIWPTLDGSFVVSSCGQVYNASDLANPVKSIGAYRHVDSTLGGSVLGASGSALTLFDSTLVQSGTDLVPPWAEDGYGRTATISKAFFNSDASRRFAIVSDSASPSRHGLVVFP
jgi:hypothetical protein